MKSFLFSRCSPFSRQLKCLLPTEKGRGSSELCINLLQGAQALLSCVCLCVRAHVYTEVYLDGMGPQSKHNAVTSPLLVWVAHTG